MKKYAIILSFLACALIACFGFFFGKRGALLSPAEESALSRLPVMKNGRLMPLSSASADILRFLCGKTSFKINGKNASAAEWLAYANAHEADAESLPFFKTDNRELQNLLGIKGRYYSCREIENNFEKVWNAAVAEERSPFNKACRIAIEKVAVFENAARALALSEGNKTPRETYDEWQECVNEAAREIEKAKEQNRKPDSQKVSKTFGMLKSFQEKKKVEEGQKSSNILAIQTSEGWQTPLDTVLDRSPDEGELNVFSLYADLVEKISKNQNGEISDELDGLEKTLNPPFKIRFENFANRLDIFYRGAIMYAAAALLLLGAAAKRLREPLFAAAAVFIICAFISQTLGIAARMYIQMRPPVTNMYSSVIFAGWAAVGISLFLMFKRGKKIYAIAAAPIGFLSLVVAINLPYSGDTMGRMIAVLNSNFWLTAHIVPMMLGYCGVFLAGFAAASRLFFNALKLGKVSAESNAEFAKTVYAILCFALVFSFAGTMLGGVWANLSWGRFWGWDPKENGALMVVLWSAFAIHLYAVKYIGARGLMALACLASVVAAWAWFGVNMLGIGLHSYGFTSGGWKYLVGFAAIQTAAAALALVPCRKK
ncbi:MAG: cytochrome c biogenesis protein CcsA [Opitutales bacterium]|nr:cytochrome c biogenesis protein CcsA [Opitutales bacterium]